MDREVRRWCASAHGGTPRQGSCYDADDDVLRHTVIVDYSGHPYVARHHPTPEELARRE